jgi:uncharacterized sulfatase
MGMEVPDIAPYANKRWPGPQKGHAAMITRMDKDIGKLFARLKANGIDRNTIVFFTSDNGPHKEGGADPKFFKSSGPLTGYKRSLHDGGIRVPMIVRWPGKIKPGSLSDHICAFWDFLPTAAELAGIDPPRDIDGISMLPGLLGKEQPIHEYLYWEFWHTFPTQAVRMGNWKGIRNKHDQPIRLFNVKNDIGETKDVADKHPKLVAKVENYFKTGRTVSPDWPTPLDSPLTDFNKPNILWITCEDMSPDLGCYGDSWSISPNIDKLTGEGLRYTNAFSISGVCAPSRSALITGMYPTTIGSHHMRSKAVPPPYVKCFTEYLRKAGYYCTNNSKTDYNFNVPITAWDESSTKAHWRKRPNKNQSFFAVFNFTTTHESRIRIPAGQFAELTKRLTPSERHNPDQAVVPPYYPDTPETRKDWANYYDLITAMDKQVADLLNQLDEDGLSDSTIVFFYSDHGRGLPRAKRWIYDSGTHVPLIVRWPGTIQPGTVCDDLVCFIDFGPTVLSLAGVKIPDYIQGKAFLGEQKSQPRKYVFAARDRMDETYDIIRCVRDKQYKYIRNFEPEKTYAQHIAYMDKMPTMQIMRELNALGKLKGPQKLYFRQTKPFEELYDITADPHEINNLADSPAHRKVLKKMGQILTQWMKDTGDLGLIPEKQLNKRRMVMAKDQEWSETTTPSATLTGMNPKGLARVKISCTTPGASIGYTRDKRKWTRWIPYTEELKLKHNETVRIKASRLGYKDSPEIKATFKNTPGSDKKLEVVIVKKKKAKQKK